MAEAGSRIHRLPLIPPLRILETDSAILGKKERAYTKKPNWKERLLRITGCSSTIEREGVADRKSKTDSSENRTCPGRR